MLLLNYKHNNHFYQKISYHNILNSIVVLITKKIVGNTPGGVIHIIWKDHGPYLARDFVSNT